VSIAQPRILSLFSGIGALDLAVEAVTGGRTVVQVEAVPYRRAVLAKHWPDAQRHNDVCTFTAPTGSFDIMCGGFPCQDISPLGSKKGLAGTKSGLWREYVRILREVQPHAIFIENVQDLRTRGLNQVLQDLTTSGYHAVWASIEARTAGIQLRRARIFLLAISTQERFQGDATTRLLTRALTPIPYAHRCRHDVPSPSDRQGSSAYDGPEPAVLRTAYGNPRGLDAHRRRERVASIGDSVSPPQAIAAYSWCAEQLYAALTEAA
jgi:DNA-cytosine methyltransferase